MKKELALDIELMIVDHLGLKLKELPPEFKRELAIACTAALANANSEGFKQGLAQCD